MKALSTSKHKYFLSQPDSDGICTVNKVAAGYLGVSECGLFWQGACHLSLSVPCQMTRHRWPPPLWNVPQMAEGRQGTFEKYQLHLCLWRAGRSGLSLLSLASWPFRSMTASAQRSYLLKHHIRQSYFMYEIRRERAETGSSSCFERCSNYRATGRAVDHALLCDTAWKWRCKTREGFEITLQVGVLPAPTCT